MTLKIIRWIPICLVYSLTVVAQEKITQSLPAGEVVRLRPVKVDFVVRDKGKRVTENLSDKDFRVYEEVRVTDERGREKAIWQEREIKAFYQGQNLPLRFVLCVDTSSSVFGTQGRDIKKMLQKFVTDVMRPGLDAVLLLPFGTYVREYKPGPNPTDGKMTRREFSENQTDLLTDIEKIPRGNSTPLFDALEASIRRLEEEAQKKKVEEYALALVLISDGQENASRVYPERFGNDRLKAYFEKKEQLEKKIRRMDNIPVYVLYTGDSEQFRKPLIADPARGGPISPGVGTAYDWLRSLAMDSGGSLLDFTTLKRQQEALTRIREELTKRYSLIFYPEDPIKGEVFRRVRIEKTHLDKKGQRVADKQYTILAPPGFSF